MDLYVWVSKPSWPLFLFSGYLCCYIGFILYILRGLRLHQTKSIDVPFISRNVVELSSFFRCSFLSLSENLTLYKSAPLTIEFEFRVFYHSRKSGFIYFGYFKELLSLEPLLWNTKWIGSKQMLTIFFEGLVGWGSRVHLRTSLWAESLTYSFLLCHVFCFLFVWLCRFLKNSSCLMSVYLSLQWYFNRLYIIMWDNIGAGIINGVVTWEQILYVVTENAAYVSAFDAISKFKK